MSAPTAVNENDDRDLLAEWLELGREVLERYWPKATHAVLVAEQGEGLPAVQLVVTLNASVSACPVPPPREQPA
jgi:hypothetical protein